MRVDAPSADGAYILVVDDEPDICNLVARCLEAGGFGVASARSGMAMWRLLDRRPADLVVLDLMLPGEDGLSLLRELRARFAALPVIILTAMGAPDDRVLGLESGADDYVPKPFEPRELLARVRTVLRRSERSGRDGGADLDSAVRQFAGWRLDCVARRLVAPDGQDVPLTSTEYALLDIFTRRPNEPMGRERLFELVRKRPAPACDRSIDVHVSHLRRKLEEEPQRPRLIRTVHGVGYVFTPAAENG
jgi:two-component system OmpR family response regulator